MVPATFTYHFRVLLAICRRGLPRSLRPLRIVLLAAGVAGLLATPGQVRAQGECQELFERAALTGSPEDVKAFEECEAREYGGGAGSALLGGGAGAAEPVDDARAAGAGTLGLILLLGLTLLTPVPGDEVVAGGTLGARLLAWLRGSRGARWLSNLLGRNPLAKPPWTGTGQSWGTVRNWLVDAAKSGKIRNAKDLETALGTAADGLGVSRTSLLNNYVGVDKFLRTLVK